MSDDNNADHETDLDAFSRDFFGKNEPEAEPAKPAVEAEDDESELDADESPPENHDDEADDNDDKSDEAPKEQKQRKSRYQERIDQLTEKARTAERELAEIKARLDKPKESEAPKTVDKTVQDDTPQPDALNEDGTEKYPLGEFDPQYIRDITRHALDQELRTRDEKAAVEANQRKMDAEKEELNRSWQNQLPSAKERYPDFQEKGEQLFGTFAGIDAKYGEYLSATIMSMDVGADVLYYLASHIDEADAIVKSGPTKATLALGRIAARFDKPDEAQKPVIRQSKAPVPPRSVNKGSATARTEVPDDTDDLDAFAKKFFSKRR